MHCSNMATLDTKDVFTKVTNFHLGKLKFQHSCLHSFAFLLTMDNEKRINLIPSLTTYILIALQKFKIANICDFFGSCGAS